MRIIEHLGIVTSVKYQSVVVQIQRNAACDGCHAKGVCGTSDQRIVDVDIATPVDSEYQIGDRVTVLMKPSMGLKAVWWAYGLPFVLFLMIFFGFFAATQKEALSGLLAIIGLIPYYTLMWSWRDRFQKKFLFEIKK